MSDGEALVRSLTLMGEAFRKEYRGGSLPEYEPGEFAFICREAVKYITEKESKNG